MNLWQSMASLHISPHLTAPAALPEVRPVRVAKKVQTADIEVLLLSGQSLKLNTFEGAACLDGRPACLRCFWFQHRPVTLTWFGRSPQLTSFCGPRGVRGFCFWVVLSEGWCKKREL